MKKPFSLGGSLHIESNTFNNFEHVKSIRSIIWISFETLHDRLFEVCRTLGFEVLQLNVSNFLDQFENRAREHGLDMEHLIEGAPICPQVHHCVVEDRLA